MMLKVGDKIRLVKNASSYKVGDTGEITCVDDSERPYLVKMDKTDSRIWLSTDYVELIREEKPLKFKVGDRVKVSQDAEPFYFSHTHPLAGKEGNVISIDLAVETNLLYRIETDEGRRGWIQEKYVEEIPAKKEIPLKEETKTKFKGGDKVFIREVLFSRSKSGTPIVPGVDSMTNPEWKGRCGFVIDDDFCQQEREEHPEAIPVGIEGYKSFTDREKWYWFHRYGLVLITEEIQEEKQEEVKEIEYHIGDTVKIIDGWGIKDSGKTGEITAMDSSIGASIRVDYGDDFNWYKPECINLVEKSKTPNKFKVGEIVNIIGTDQNAKVDAIYKMKVRLEFHDGEILFKKNEEIQLLSKKNEEIQLLSKKNEGNYRIGDVVRIVNSVGVCDRLGREGIVTTIDNQINNPISVNFDENNKHDFAWVQRENIELVARAKTPHPFNLGDTVIILKNKEIGEIVRVIFTHVNVKTPNGEYNDLYKNEDVQLLSEYEKENNPYAKYAEWIKECNENECFNSFSDGMKIILRRGKLRDILYCEKFPDGTYREDEYKKIEVPF